MFSNRTSVTDFGIVSLVPASADALDSRYQRPIDRNNDHRLLPLSAGMSQLNLQPPCPFLPWTGHAHGDWEADTIDALVAKIEKKLDKARPGSMGHFLLSTGLECSLIYKSLFEHRGTFETVSTGAHVNFMSYGQKSAPGVPDLHYDNIGDKKFEAKLDTGYRSPQVAMGTPYNTPVFAGLTKDEILSDLNRQQVGYDPVATKDGRMFEAMSAHPGEYFVLPELAAHASPAPAHPSMPQSQAEARAALAGFPETAALLGDKKVARIFVTTQGLMKPH